MFLINCSIIYYVMPTNDVGDCTCIQFCIQLDYLCYTVSINNSHILYSSKKPLT